METELINKTTNEHDRLSFTTQLAQILLAQLLPVPKNPKKC